MVLLLAIVGLSRASVAQTVGAGTVQVAAVTGISANRQTITSDPLNSPIGAPSVNLTSVNVAGELTYFIGSRCGIGALIAHQQIALTARERDAEARFSTVYFGPLLSCRVPLGGRSTLALTGSFGGAQTTIVNRNTGVGDAQDLSVYGRSWLAGAALSFGMTPRTSLDLGVRYQASTFSGQPGTVDTTSAGLLLSAGFSLYFH